MCCNHFDLGCVICVYLFGFYFRVFVEFVPEYAYVGVVVELRFGEELVFDLIGLVKLWVG